MSKARDFTDLVLFKDRYLIICNKPAGMPVSKTPEGPRDLHTWAMAYAKRDLHVVNRIDQPATGIVVFAKTASAMTFLTEQFKDRTIQKDYLVVTGQPLPGEKGRLKHYLKRATVGNKTVPGEEGDGSLCILDYVKIGESDHYHFYLIRSETGFHHHIRAQLAIAETPVKGDVRYGFDRGNRDRSIHLHAWKMKFKHPSTKEVMEVEAPLPTEDTLWDILNGL